MQAYIFIAIIYVVAMNIGEGTNSTITATNTATTTTNNTTTITTTSTTTTTSTLPNALYRIPNPISNAAYLNIINIPIFLIIIILRPFPG